MNGSASKIYLLVIGLFLSACETAVPIQTLPEITFGHLQPIALNVVDIQFADERATGRAGQPDVAQNFPVPPETAMLRWAQSRLQVAGTTGTARFVIHRAGVTETPLQIDRGIGGLFKKEVSERYDANVEASLEIFDARNIRRAFAIARASETATVREDASPNDRQRIWFTMVERLMASFDKAMDASIRQHMVGYIQ